MNTFFKNMRLQSPGAAIMAVVIIALSAGYLLKSFVLQRPSSGKSSPAAQPAAGAEKTARMVYVCPTMCIPPAAKPGACPICGMQLIAVSGADEGGSNAAARMRLSEEAQKLAEIQVAPVERRAVSAEITAFGRIAYDPAWISRVTALTSGVISKAFLDRTGVLVKFGDPLFEIYSYEIYNTEQELLETAKSVPGFFPLPSVPITPGSLRERDTLQARLKEEKAARTGKKADTGPEADRKRAAFLLQRLGRLGVTKQDMDLFMQKREPAGTATVYSRFNGLVIERQATLGSYINIGTPLCVITDPRYLWLKLSVYEADLPWLRIRQDVEFQTEAYPGERFKGRLEFIEPVFNKESQTFEVGVKCPDTGGKLRADMAVRAIIRADLAAGMVSGPEAGPEKQMPLVIPDTAPLITGRRAVVYVAVPGEKGLFEGREIVLGPRAKDYYVVKSGLKEGEQVVVNGNFKIDSALQILGRPSMINSVATEKVQRPLPGVDIHIAAGGVPAAVQKK